jgi:Fe2+ or Zn2+ uptake regulation protein
MTNKYHEILQNAGIRPSLQRIAIYAYMCEHPVHPDVETVYNDLYPVYPTLSKTTVYNTLKLFEENKIVQSLKIEDDKLRFDADMSEHLHFKCMKCQKIFDIPSTSEYKDFILPKGFKTSKMQINLWGLCSDCSQKKS